MNHLGAAGLVSALFLALAACGEPPLAPAPMTPAAPTTGPLHEKSTHPVTTYTVPGASAAARLEARRLDANGRRAIVHFDGTTSATLIDEPNRFPLDANGLAHDGATVVCSHVNEGRGVLAVSVRCGVRAAGETTFARLDVAGAPSAWLHDVCAASGFTALVSKGASPLWDRSRVFDGTPRCEAFRWERDGGWRLLGPSACHCNDLPAVSP